ncbi:MAG TPA: helix-turn-helix transcriptional regulator [Solirubrobacterales bacterium]
MAIRAQESDAAILEQLGSRLRQHRLARNLSQARLAEEAGIGRVTLQRIEEGSAAASLPSLIRILRALGLTEGFDQLVPEVAPSPIEEVRRRGAERRRAGSPRGAEKAEPTPEWEWGDEGPE